MTFIWVVLTNKKQRKYMPSSSSSSSAHSSSRLRHLRKTCEEVFDVVGRGARLLPRDIDSLVLLDFDMLSSQHVLHLCELFPGLQLCTHENKASLTNYEIIITLAYTRVWYQRAEVAHLILTVLVSSLFLICMEMMMSNIQQVV